MKYLLFLFPIFSFSQIINIPDQALKNYFVGPYGYNIDFNHDGEVSQDEALTLTNFTIGGIGSTNNVADFTGLKDFANLQNIYIFVNQATTLDVSNLTNLKTLKIFGSDNWSFLDPIMYCPITILNVNGCTALESIDIKYSSIQNLDLTTNTALKHFFGNNCKLQIVNFSGLTQLENVQMMNGILENATFNGNIALTDVIIRNQPNLQSLNLTNSSNLFTLDASNSSLHTLEIEGLSNLTYLNCSNNQINQLNLSGLSSLESIRCEFNQLDKLDFSEVLNIKLIKCANNLIEELIVSDEAHELINVSCSHNKIKILDFSDLGIKFKGVDCSDNLLEEISVKGTDLRQLLCQNNKLTNLDLEWLQNLEDIDCSNNQIISVNMKHVIRNPYDTLNVIDPDNNPTMNFESNPLLYACVDDFQIDHYNAYFSAKGMNDVNTSSTCEFEPLIYPNPVSSTLNINAFNTIDDIKIYDMNGRLVLYESVNNNLYSSPVSELQTGIYILELISDNQSKMIKFIKN